MRAGAHRMRRLVYPRVFVLVLVLSAFVSTSWSPVAAAAPGDVRVSANFTDRGSNGSYNQVQGLRVQIWRDGVKVLDRPARIPCGGCDPQPMPEGYATRPVRVVQLDASPEPEVVFTVLSVGAHCCSYAKIFRWEEELGRYLATTQDFRDGIYYLKDLRHDGVPLFVDTDTRLAYRFSCYICAIYPPQVLEYRTGQMVDVTRSFPKQVKENLALVTRGYQRARGRDVRGLLATIAADYCLLGRCGAGFALVRRAVRAGRVDVKDPQLEIGPHGRRFIPALRRFLGKLGYL